MGYSRCAVPGCPSRPGDGTVFQYLPKCSHRRQAWLKVWPKWIPLELKDNSSRQVALCEKHFPETDIEIGAYGKRRIGSTAVPCFFGPTPLLERSPLSNVTNFHRSPHQSRQAVQESHSASPVKSSNQSTPILKTWRMASKRIEFSATRSELSENFGVSREDIPTVMPDDANSDAFWLDEKTGCLRLVPRANTISVDHDNMILDEVSGILLPPSPGRTKTKVEFTADFFNKQQSCLENVVESLEEIVSVQASNIALLKEQNESKDQVINEQSRKLKLLQEANGSFSKQLSTLARSQLRVKQRMKNFGRHWLYDSQINRLARNNKRGVKWTIDEIREGLILKMKCGTTGYSAFVDRYPILPSVRSLQETVKFIRFDTGILHEIFDLLECMAQKIPDLEKDCQVVLDEMQLEESEKYDNALKKIVGSATLPSHTGIAKRALVFILAGISRRWKVSVAVEFTNHKSLEAKRSTENPTGETYKNIINEVVKKAEKAGLFVCSVTSDMGPDNLAFWRACGVTTGRQGEVRNSFPNPVRNGKEIFILPDSVHLMKSIKGMMESNGTICLPPDIVEEEGLPSAVVNYMHIDDLLKFESEHELRVAFRLRKDNVHCKKQFKTMNVGTTKAVLCHRTGVGLQLLAKEKQNPSYQTTAWFIIFLNTFFALATCRNRGLAISKANPEAYEKAVKLIKQMAYMFQNMRVGNQGSFKPVQRGVRVLCAGFLSLIEYFLEERRYKYVMLGRFTGDCIENIFSLVRLTQAVPNASMFLQCLKVITLAQFSHAVKGSSYDFEDSDPVHGIDFLEEARRRAEDRARTRFYNGLDELMDNPIRQLSEADYLLISEWERSVIYDMAGGVVASILRSNQELCDACISAVKWQGAAPHPSSLITEMKEFTMLRTDDGSKGALQISVSDAVHKALLTAEITFRLYREATVNFKNTDIKQYYIEQLMYVWNGSNIPECHQIGRKILRTYVDGRLKEYGKIQRELLKSHEAPQRSSKSVAMRQAANQMAVTSSSK